METNLVDNPNLIDAFNTYLPLIEKLSQLPRDAVITIGTLLTPTPTRKGNYIHIGVPGDTTSTWFIGEDEYKNLIVENVS